MVSYTASLEARDVGSGDILLLPAQLSFQSSSPVLSMLLVLSLQSSRKTGMSQARLLPPRNRAAQRQLRQLWEQHLDLNTVLSIPGVSPEQFEEQAAACGGCLQFFQGR